MADLKYYDIIQKPVITEKSMSLMESKKYTFYVHPKATKVQIKEAVEKMFDGSKVEKVTTLLDKGKPKRRGNIPGRTTIKKKAIVKLAANSKDIEVFQGM